MSDPNIIKGDELERLSLPRLGELLFLVLTSFDDDTALQIDAITNEKLYPKILLKKSIKLSKYFQAKNVGLGDIVSIFCENRLEYSVVLVACYLLGITFSPLNPDYTEKELQHMLELTRPKFLFTSYTNLNKTINILPRHSCIKELILFENKDVNHPQVKLFADLIAGWENEKIENFQVSPYPMDTVATILCSSGTTGLPKGVMLTHENITAYLDVGRAIIMQLLIEDGLDDHFIGVIPFFHSFGFMVMLTHLIRGSATIVMNKFVPRIFLGLVEKYQVKRIIAPPPLLLYLLKNPLVKEYDLSSVRSVYTGAAPLGKKIEEELKKRFNLKNLGQGYGMTETTLSVSMSPIDRPKPGSVGKVTPGMMIKIIDPEGRSLGPYQEGEICVKGPLVMKGYINNEAATKQCIDKDNWLHTGDVGYFDNEQYLFIVDRIKELIKYKAYQVAPAELEAILLTNPAVLDAAVIGKPDEYAGELPLAFVVPKPDVKVTERELQKFVADRVSVQKQLRGGVIFINEIPKNPSGKILRRVLREKLKYQLSSKL